MVEPSSSVARPIQDRPPGAQQAGPPQRVGDREREQEGEGVACPHHLHHRDLTAEILRRGIEAREGADRPADQGDADQPRAACGRLARGSIGEHVDGGVSWKLRRHKRARGNRVAAT